jgi:hypothetical protein
MTDFEWQKECNYIAQVTEKRGIVPEMNNDTQVFIRYCEMQCRMAEKQGFCGPATYIQECIDDLRG